MLEWDRLLHDRGARRIIMMLLPLLMHSLMSTNFPLTMITLLTISGSFRHLFRRRTIQRLSLASLH